MALDAAFPQQPEQLDRRWLAACLAGAGVLEAPDQLRGFRVEPLALGIAFSSRLFRLHLDLDGPARARTAVVKLPIEQAVDPVTRLYRSEVNFYRRLSGALPIGAPRLYFGDITADASRFVLLIEDLVEHRCADQITGFDRPQMEAAVDLLARFHAVHWGRADLAELGYEPLSRTFMVAMLPLLIGESWTFYRSVARSQPGPAACALMAAYVDHLPWMLRELAAPQTLIHGDARGDNWFFDARHEARLIDFQLVALGSGMLDLADLVSQSLTTEDRRRWETDLVRRYVAGLAQAGVASYGFEEAWRQYRLATWLMIFMPLVAIRSWERTTDRGRDLCLTLLERAGAAIEELAVADLVPEARTACGDVPG